MNAVVIRTADHTHAFIANWAMNRGLHVYCEKPLANSVEEARVVRANFLKNQSKLATQVGDMGRHTMDIAWSAIDAGLLTSAEAKGDPFNPEVTPVKLEMHFDHPANEWRPAIRVSWYQGGALPEPPSKFIDLRRIHHGALFEGSRCYLVSDFGSRALFPNGDKADLSPFWRLTPSGGCQQTRHHVHDDRRRRAGVWPGDGRRIARMGAR